MLTEDRIKTVVLNILGRIAPEADLQNLDPAERLRNQFDFDSVDFVNFAAELQEQLKVVIPEQDYPLLATLEGCVGYLRSKTAA